MKHIGGALFFALILEMYAPIPAKASTINFDDLAATAGDVILSNYQGYSWSNISAYTNTSGFPGYNSSIVSPPNAAYTAGDALGAPLISAITASDPFNFISGSFGSGWYDGLSVTVNGLYNGTMVFSSSFTVNTSGQQFLTFNFTDINEVAIFSTVTASTTDPYGCGPSGCSQVTFDDLTITPGTSRPPTSAPEPASLLLIGIAVVLLAASRLISFRTVSK